MNNPADDDDSDDEGVQPEVLASYFSFAVRAVSAHRRLAIGVFLAISGLALAAVALWPRTYQCETKLMTQASPALSEQGNQAVRDALNFKGAYESIMRQENLISVVRQTKLVKNWSETRPFALRIKDNVMNALRGAPSDRDMEAVLVATLKTRLQVQIGDGVLTLTIDWQDPTMAARLLEVVTQNFLEARHVAEISTIADYISILEGHAAKLRHEIDRSVEQIQRLREEKLAQYGRKADGAAATSPAPPPERPVAPSRAAPPPVRSAAEDSEVARLKVMLDAKQRAITELEESRGRRLLEQQSRLRELLLKYTEAHPLVEDAKQSVRSLSEESQQVASLRTEVQSLQTELERKKNMAGDAQAGAAGFAAPRRRPAGSGVPAGTAEPLPPEVLRFMQDSTGDTLDPAVAAQFRHSVEKYTSLRGTISSARIDLDTAQAAFQYRYKVMIPPEPPNKPSKPKVPLILIAGILGGLLLGLGAAVVAALKSDRIVERWQVYQLSLPVLSELQVPDYRKD
jgi:hypothetical protein